MGTPAETTFTWLDYDEEETRKARELYAALDAESVDALGLGSIRDGFANLMFPGTSTVQTRVRYFVLVPYAAQAVAQQRPRDARHFDRAFKEMELTTMAALKATTRSGDGVIGAVAGRNTKRLPSDVYWNGMARWGVVRRSDDASPELSTLAAFRSWVLNGNRRLVDEADEVVAASPFFDELPPSPPDFPGERLAILPRKEEAAYLLRRMQRLTVPTNQVTGQRAATLLAAMATDKQLGTAQSIFAIEPDDLEPYAGRLLRHAQGFSQVMQGSRLLYNRMLFEQFRASGHGEPPGSLDDLEELEDRWVASVHRENDKLEEWRAGLDDLFHTLRRAGVRISSGAQRFVRDWCELAVAAPREALDSPTCRSAVQLREASIKRRGTARLSNPAALERWQGGLFGSRYMDFRFQVARRHVTDCLKASG